MYMLDSSITEHSQNELYASLRSEMLLEPEFSEEVKSVFHKGKENI